MIVVHDYLRTCLFLQELHDAAEVASGHHHFVTLSTNEYWSMLTTSINSDGGLFVCPWYTQSVNNFFVIH